MPLGPRAILSVVEATGNEALKKLVIKLAARARGRCEGCLQPRTTRIFSPVEGLPDEALALMLCAACLETLGREIQSVDSVRGMRLRIAQVLSRPKG